MLPLSDLGWCMGMHHLVSFISMAETFEVVYIKTIIVICVNDLVDFYTVVYLCVCLAVCMLLYPVDVDLQNVFK